MQAPPLTPSDEIASPAVDGSVFDDLAIAQN